MTGSDTPRAQRWVASACRRGGLEASGGLRRWRPTALHVLGRAVADRGIGRGRAGKTPGAAPRRGPDSRTRGRVRSARGPARSGPPVPGRTRTRRRGGGESRDRPRGPGPEATPARVDQPPTHPRCRGLDHGPQAPDRSRPQPDGPLWGAPGSPAVADGPRALQRPLGAAPDPLAGPADGALGDVRLVPHAAAIVAPRRDITRWGRGGTPPAAAGLRADGVCGPSARSACSGWGTSVPHRPTMPRTIRGPSGGRPWGSTLALSIGELRTLPRSGFVATLD